MSYVDKYYFGQGKLIVLSSSGTSFDVTINGETETITATSSKTEISVPPKSEVSISYGGHTTYFTFGFGECKAIPISNNEII